MATSDDDGITVVRLDQSDGEVRGRERRATRRIQEERWAIGIQGKRDAIRHTASPAHGTPIVCVILDISIGSSREDSAGISLRGQKLLCSCRYQKTSRACLQK